MTRLLRRTVFTVATASTLAAPSLARAQSPRSWRMVTSWPKNLPGPGMSAARLAKRIETMSDSRIAIRVYGAGELVPAFETMDAVARGVADLAHTAAVFWTGKMRAAAFFLAVPFGLTPLEHAAWIEHGGGQALWDELYGQFGVKPFMAGNTGMSMGGWFRNEIRSLDDFKGLKMAMPGLGGEMYEPLGLVQVSLPPAERLSALVSGAVDAVEFAGPFSDLALGFHKAAKNYYWPGIHEPSGTGELLISRSLWDGLAADLQALVAEAARAENAFSMAESEMMNATALKRLVSEHDVILREFPADLVAAARESAASVLQRFAGAGGIDARIHESYTRFAADMRPWSSVSTRAFINARGGF